MNGMNDETRGWDQPGGGSGGSSSAEGSAAHGSEEQAADAGRPVAYCQNCGKGLSVETRRVVGPAVYCEPCLAARLGGATGYTAPGWGPVTGAAGGPAGMPGVPGPRPIPNPGLAALLGLIPGVGAMYNEQYAKGIAHLVIFTGLVLFSHVSEIFILFIFGWIAYMSIEAHHTARARLDGTPLPNPFGLNDIGERMGFGRAWPAGPSVGTVARDAADAAAAEYRSMSGGFGTRAGAGPVVPPAAAAVNDAAAPGAAWGAPADGFTSGAGYAPGYGYGQAGYVPPTQQAGYGQPAGYGGQAGYGAQQVPYAATYVPPVPPLTPLVNRFPAGAIWLIGLGTIFLLGTTGIFRGFPGLALVGLVLIGSGVWSFVRRMTETGQSLGDDGTPLYRLRLLRAVRGASWSILIGVLLLLHALGWVRWENSWPWLIIAAGVLMLLSRALSVPATGAAYYPPPAPVAPTAGTAMVASNEAVERNEAEFRQGGN